MRILFQRRHLGDCLLLIKNGANIKQDKGTGGIPITRIETLSGGVFNRDRLGYAGIDQPGKYESFILESGDLLFSHINSKAYIGRTVLYQKEGSEVIIHGMNLLRIKVIPELLIPKYLYYTTLTEGFKSQVASSRKDAVNQSSISVSDIKRIIIPVPSLIEQQRIVDELDLLTGIIEKKNAQLRDLDALAQSIFYEMFGDPNTNERGWKYKALGDACALKAGKGIKASELSEEKAAGLYPCFGGNGIRGYIAKKSHKGTYPIIGRQGALCGNVQLATGEFYATEHAVVCTPGDGLHAVFVYYALLAMNLNQYATGVAQPGLAVKTLLPIPIVTPPMELQERFAEKICNIESQIDLLNVSLEQIDTLFHSRMDYYFND